MPPNGKLKWQSPLLRKVRSGYAKLRHFCFCSKVQRALKGKCVPGRGEQVLLLYFCITDVFFLLCGYTALSIR